MDMETPGSRLPEPDSYFTGELVAADERIQLRKLGTLVARKRVPFLNSVTL